MIFTPFFAAAMSLFPRDDTAAQSAARSNSHAVDMRAAQRQNSSMPIANGDVVAGTFVEATMRTSFRPRMPHQTRTPYRRHQSPPSLSVFRHARAPPPAASMSAARPPPSSSKHDPAMS